MILYFSATGNCKYVAARLAAAFGQETVSIVDCIRDGVYSFTDDTIGIVSPTYFWGLPSIVKEFLEKAELHTDYLYFISTYGTTPGASDAMAGKAIGGKTIDAFCSVPWLPAPLSQACHPVRKAHPTARSVYESACDAVISGEYHHECLRGSRKNAIRQLLVIWEASVRAAHLFLQRRGLNETRTIKIEQEREP